jgi:hypothetical protein
MKHEGTKKNGGDTKNERKDTKEYGGTAYGKKGYGKNRFPLTLHPFCAIFLGVFPFFLRVLSVPVFVSPPFSSCLRVFAVLRPSRLRV